MATGWFANDVADLTGKVIIVTGATSGIGLAITKFLYHKGAKVYLAARNEKKAVACIKAIETERKDVSGQVLFHHLDLDDPKEAKSSAERFLQVEEKLDILLNNAAMGATDFQLVDNLGIQRVMIINYFSTVAFTETLLPLLKKTGAGRESDVRIVNLSSYGHTFVPNGQRFKTADDFNKTFDKNVFGSLTRYGLTKIAINLWTVELQNRLLDQGANILVVSVHPGTILTEGNDGVAARMPRPLTSLYNLYCKFAFDPVEKGIGTTVIAIGSAEFRKDVKAYEGAYIVPPGKVGKPSPQSVDPELAKELRAFTVERFKEWGITFDSV